MPAITIKRQTMYNTFQTAGFGLTYRQAKIETIIIIIAAAIPCRAETATDETPQAERISATAYSIVAATITQNEILFNPHIPLELDDDFFVCLAIMSSFYFKITLLTKLCQIKWYYFIKKL